MGPNGSKVRVTLSRPFHAGATEVTLGQYRKFKPGHTVEGADDEFNADDRPAAMVNWDDARAFCAWLSEQPEEKQAGRAYALPWTPTTNPAPVPPNRRDRVNRPLGL